MIEIAIDGFQWQAVYFLGTATLTLQKNKKYLVDGNRISWKCCLSCGYSSLNINTFQWSGITDNDHQKTTTGPTNGCLGLNVTINAIWNSGYFLFFHDFSFTWTPHICPDTSELPCLFVCLSAVSLSSSSDSALDSTTRNVVIKVVRGLMSGSSIEFGCNYLYVLMFL